MKILKFIIIIIAIIVIAVFVLLLWLGFFKPVKLEEKQTGGYIVAGTEIKGPYSNVAPTMNEVHNTLSSMGIECTKGFGIYYDNPRETPQEECRSFVGNVIEAEDSGRIEEIINKGLKVDTIPVKNAAVIEFPVKTSLSYMLGPIKAYPALNEYMEKNNATPSYPPFEIYDMTENKALYIMQL